MTDRVSHWDTIYRTREIESLGWFEATPEISLELVTIDGTPRSVIDVGSGLSSLVDHLVAGGVDDISLLDVSQEALERVTQRLAPQSVQTVCADILEWTPQRTWQVWHDRAVFHFLTDPNDRHAYAERASTAVEPGGIAVIATFAPDGPETCSGLNVLRSSPAELEALFASHHFDLELTRRAVHVTPSGVEQPFTWVVLRRRQEPSDVA